MDLPNAVLNLALILLLPSTSSVNLRQESHEGMWHCRHPRPQLPRAGAEGALAGSIKLSASPMGSAAYKGCLAEGPRVPARGLSLCAPRQGSWEKGLCSTQCLGQALVKEPGVQEQCIPGAW